MALFSKMKKAVSFPPKGSEYVTELILANPLNVCFLENQLRECSGMEHLSVSGTEPLAPACSWSE